MKEPYRFSPATVPSRVSSVKTLMNLGVRFEGFEDDPDVVLAEIRPVLRPPVVEGQEYFLATVETATATHLAEFTASRDWFFDQFPYWMLGNIPNDAAPIAPQINRRRQPANSPSDQARELAQRWRQGGQPRQTTRRFMNRMMTHHVVAVELFADIANELQQTRPRRISAATSLMLAVALQQFADVMDSEDELGEEAA